MQVILPWHTADNFISLRPVFTLFPVNVENSYRSEALDYSRMHSWAQLTNNVASANRLTLTQTQNVAQLIAKR